MFTSTVRQFALLAILLLVLAACGSGSDKKATTAPEPTPTEEPTADLLVVDDDIFDPDGYYSFKNPGGWVASGLQLKTEDGDVVINVLPSPTSTGTFEDYMHSWMDDDWEIIKTDDGITYASGVIGDTQTVLVETPDGVRWGIQMKLTDKFGNEANLDDYAADLLAIALSATYTYRETDGTPEAGE